MMRRLPLFLLLVLIALQWPLWNGYWELYRTRQAVEAQLKVNQELVYRNAALQADIRDLRDGSDAIQERARLQLGMVKSDEVFVQVMDQPSVVSANLSLPMTAGAVAPQSAPAVVAPKTAPVAHPVATKP